MTTQLSPRLAKLKRWYVASAILLLNSLLLAAVLGGAFLLARGIQRAWATRAGISSVERKYGERIFAAYPGMSRGEVRTLLREIWTRPCVFEPFTQFKEAAFTGRFVNVSEHGFRHSRDQAAWPPDPKAVNVFFFGGSTAFGYGLPDDETVPSFLQAWLRRQTDLPVNVYNFGRAYYYSSQEVVLFLRLLAAGHVPSVAVFLDGLNDARYVDDQPMYSNRVREMMRGRNGISFPFARGQGEDPAEVSAAEADPGSLAEKVVQRYRANMQLAAALAGAYGVRVAFVWQPIPSYKYDLQHHRFKDGGFRRHPNAPAVYERMNDRRRSWAREGSFIWCADLQEDAPESFYVDEVHYNATLARRLADRIGEALLARGLTPGPPARVSPESVPKAQ